MRVLLDTTILIDLLRGRSEQRKLLDAMVQRGDSLATTSVNVGEGFGGLRPSEEAKALKRSSML